MRTARSSSRGGLHQAPPQEQVPPDQPPSWTSPSGPGTLSRDQALPGPGTPQDQAPPRSRHPPGAGTPPVDRHTLVNILPCPKLRLRVVTKKRQCFNSGLCSFSWNCVVRQKTKRVGAIEIKVWIGNLNVFRRNVQRLFIFRLIAPQIAGITHRHDWG